MKLTQETANTFVGCFIFLMLIVGLGAILVEKIISPSSSSPTISVPDDFSVKYAGREQLKSQLKDPGSLQIIEEKVEHKADGVHYWARYRAKNSFGGYTEEVYFSH